MRVRARATYRDCSAKRPRNQINRIELDRERWYFRGAVITEHGVVAVYHEPGLLHLQTVQKGRLYESSIDHVTYTERGVMREAVAFAQASYWRSGQR